MVSFVNCCNLMCIFERWNFRRRVFFFGRKGQVYSSTLYRQGKTMDKPNDGIA